MSAEIHLVDCTTTTTSVLLLQLRAGMAGQRRMAWAASIDADAGPTDESRRWRRSV
jgi:hypothetical protein